MTSPAWLSDYATALRARDHREKAQEAHINAYTKLADRTARLEAERCTAGAPAPAPADADNTAAKAKPSPSRFNRASPAPPLTTTTTTDNPPTDATPPPDALASLRADLASTQTSRAALQQELASTAAALATLRGAAAREARALGEARGRAAQLERRLRDRESEVRGKTRLAEAVQDELVSVNLQLHMAERRSDELERENRELVDRWMKYKREEAERINTQSNWG